MFVLLSSVLIAHSLVLVRGHSSQALRLQCYSCMSPYLRDHYPYISHLYRKPLSFDQHCDMPYLDREYLYARNCTDLCISLQMRDAIGGRRRISWMRGCLSDIIGFNQSVVRSLGERYSTQCLETTARELFLITAARQELEPSKILLCGCSNALCNSGYSLFSSFLLLFLFLLAVKR